MEADTLKFVVPAFVAAIGWFAAHQSKLKIRIVALKLHVAPATFNIIVQVHISISSEIALRLSKILGRSPESWLTMQSNYNLWQAREYVNLNEVEKLAIA